MSNTCQDCFAFKAAEYKIRGRIVSRNEFWDYYDTRINELYNWPINWCTFYPKWIEVKSDHYCQQFKSKE